MSDHNLQTIVPIRKHIGKRVVATLIDYTIVNVFSLAYLFVFGEETVDGTKQVTGFGVLPVVGFWFCYIVLPEYLFGATLGHYATYLRVRSAVGSRLGFVQVVKRRVCDAVEISWCFGLIAFILVKSTPNGERIGDLVAKTRVVSEEERTGKK